MPGNIQSDMTKHFLDKSIKRFSEWHFVFLSHGQQKSQSVSQNGQQDCIKEDHGTHECICWQNWWSFTAATPSQYPPTATSGNTCCGKHPLCWHTQSSRAVDGLLSLHQSSETSSCLSQRNLKPSFCHALLAIEPTQILTSYTIL